MSTQAEKFKEIADAIRGVNDRVSNHKIQANNFAAEISKLDPRITPYDTSFENGYYGLRAAKCASTYLLARVCGKSEDTALQKKGDKFAYRQTNIFSPSLKVRDGEYGRIDCSSFVGLCLRGIPYDKSPYAKHKDSDATWNPSTEISGMYGKDGWEFTHLDKQRVGAFTDIGISGYSTIRTAASIGEYFYKYGWVIYDSAVDGKLTSSSQLNKYKLKPGDLVFWARGTNATANSRFKSISHVALVAENTNAYYHVTGSEDPKKNGQDVIKYVIFDDGIASGEEGDSLIDDEGHPMNTLVLICRPDYRPRRPKEETPIGVNLVEYPWTYSRKDEYKNEYEDAETSGYTSVTLAVVDKNTLKLNAKTINKDKTIALKGSANTNHYITLSPGTYQLSGITGFTGTSFALQVRYANGDDFATPIRYPGTSSTTDTFTITKETNVILRLYIAADKELSNVSMTPTLKRIS